MKFGKLKITNFMSYKKASLDMSSNGLFVIDGDVVGSKAFDNNGAGKSNLFEALTWALFGKTIKGVSADEVINNSTNSGCSVSIEIIFSDITYTISRYRKDKKYGTSLRLYKSGEDTTKSSMDTTQAFIDNMLGIDFQSFTNSVIFGQGNIIRFSTATDKGRKEILEKLLNLEYIPRAYNYIKDELFRLEKLHDKRLSEKELADQTVNSLEDQIEWIEESKNRFRFDKYVEMLSSMQIMLEYEDDIFNLDVSTIPHLDSSVLKSAQELVDNNKKAYSIHRRKHENLEDNQERINELQVGINTCEKVIDELRTNIRVLKHSSDKICPTCKRKMTDANADKLMSSMNRELSDERIMLKKFKKELSSLKIKQSEYEDSLKELDRLTRAQNNALIALSEAKEEESGREERIKRLSDLERTQRENLRRLLEISGSKYTEMKHAYELESKLKLAYLDQRAILEEIDEIDEEIDYYVFWKSAFSNTGIKAAILDSVIPFLNEKAQVYSDILTDGTITVEFVNEKTLKGGGKRDKLEIVCSRVGGGTTYKGISGGEKKRLDICQTLALRDLVASRGSNSIGLVFLDEIFESLDKTGIDRAMSLLFEIAKTSGSVYVATHITGLKDQFDRCITVVNEDNESRLQYG
jgi:DNA repair exonuclease SbcCD ATPase subunit